MQFYFDLMKIRINISKSQSNKRGKIETTTLLLENSSVITSMGNL